MTYNITQFLCGLCGQCGLTVERSLAILRSRVRISVGLLPGDSLGQAAHTLVPLSSSGRWAVTLFGFEGNRRPGRK